MAITNGHYGEIIIAECDSVKTMWLKQNKVYMHSIQSILVILYILHTCALHTRANRMHLFEYISVDGVESYGHGTYF